MVKSFSVSYKQSNQKNAVPPACLCQYWKMEFSPLSLVSTDSLFLYIIGVALHAPEFVTSGLRK